MALSGTARQRMQQNFGITTDEYNAAQELCNAIDANTSQLAGLPNSILAFTSSAGAGGAASATLTVTGLLSTDTVLSVSQKTAGANNLPLLGWTTVANNALTVQWSADPGAGGVVVVSIKR